MAEVEEFYWPTERGKHNTMKLTNGKQLSRLLRTARKHDALSDSLRAKLTTREKALKEELAEVRKHLKKSDVKVDMKGGE